MNGADSVGIRLRPPGLLALIPFLLPCLTGCAAPAQKMVAPLPESQRLALIARTNERLSQAVFFKPETGAPAELREALAPLIVWETAASEDRAVPGRGHPVIGAVASVSDTGVAIDPAEPTVYVDSTPVTIDGAEYEYITHRWYGAMAAAYDNSEPLPVQMATACRGVSMVLGPDGFPCVWLVDEPDREAELVFVSRSFEAAAAAEYGDPLPGRRFSAERALCETPVTVVAGVVEDGPVPMGPYVYLDAAGLDIRSVRCRCNSSLVDELVKSVWYKLRPVDDLEAWGIDVSGFAADLSSRLRWPKKW